MRAALLAAVLAACVLGTQGKTWVVTAGKGAPDGVSRNVILVNNELSPTLVVTQGEELKVRSF
jgi:hypothetical protein